MVFSTRRVALQARRSAVGTVTGTTATVPPGDLARRYDNYPIYDVLYVALAERRRTQLITADSRLRRTLVALGRLVAPEELLR